MKLIRPVSIFTFGGDFNRLADKWHTVVMTFSGVTSMAQDALEEAYFGSSY